MESLLDRTKNICKSQRIMPTRSKGQNFLIREDVYDSIIAAADLTHDDNVLEVGPGLGFLTEKLAEKAKSVVAVELDDKLAALLRKKVESEKLENVEVVNKDILILDIKILVAIISNIQYPVSDEYLKSNYKIVANLPYNITSIFLRKFLSEVETKPNMLVLMLQKEVAERIVAKPGKMSLLAVSVQFYADAEIVAYVPKHDFWPEPQVDSAVIKIVLKKNKISVNEKKFFQLVKFGFSSKRKMLKNNLSAGYKTEPQKVEKWLTEAKLNETIRAEGLSVEDWIYLLKIVEKNLEI